MCYSGSSIQEVENLCQSCKQRNLVSVTCSGMYFIVDYSVYDMTMSSLNRHEHQAILMSPKMCLRHEQFQKWISVKENTKDILVVIINERHCISQWGGDFQPSYSQLEKLWLFVPSHIPILLTTATFPP